MKILYIITQNETGGAQKYVSDLASNLPSDFQYLIAYGESKHNYFLKLNSHQLQNLVRQINPIKDLKAFFEIKKLIKKYNPDIVHLNSSKAGIVGSIAGWSEGKKVVFTAHGFAFLEPKNVFAKFIYWLAEFVARPFRDRIISVSSNDYKAANKFLLGNQKKLRLIFNGIDNITEQFSKHAAKQNLSKFAPQTNPENTVWVGTVANLYKTKGLEYLIQAAKTVTAKHPNTRFFIFGEGSERKALEEQIVNLDLKKQVILTGLVPKIEKQLNGVELFVLPSIKEGFPYALLSAMVTGLPIVATQVGGITDMLDDNSAILVEAKNPVAIANGVTTLIENPDKAKLLADNAKQRSKEFTLEKMVQNTIKVYKNL